MPLVDQKVNIPTRAIKTNAISVWVRPYAVDMDACPIVETDTPAVKKKQTAVRCLRYELRNTIATHDKGLA